MIFSSLPELEVFLERDRQKSTINPVRFINVETMAVWVKVKSILSRFAPSCLKISDFCEDADTAPNMILLKSKLRKTTQSTLVMPISEYLRINNSYSKKTFEDLLHLTYENSNGKLRIYVPVYRMREILENVPLDPRTVDSMLFLDTQRENDYSLTIIQQEIQVELAGNRIIGFKNYFQYWEENPDKPIILYTKNAVHYQDVVFSDDVQVIVSSYDLLLCHYRLSSDIKREYGTEEQWAFLAKHFNTSLEVSASAILGVRQWSKEILRDWSQLDDFSKWTLWLWSKVSVKYGYLGMVLENSKCVDDFIDSLYIVIFDFIDDSVNYLTNYKERLTLLQLINTAPTKKFWDRYSKVSPLHKLKVLTFCTHIEQEETIKGLIFVSKEDALPILEHSYPLLYNYLQPMQTNESLDSYFDDYRWAKVTNTTPAQFIEKVNTIAAEKGERFYKLEARNAIVESMYKENSVILFVDALGAEYIPLLKSMFDGIFTVGHCNIPSTTRFNNDFFNKKLVEKNYSLDESKHSSIEYPASIIKELELVEALKKDVIRLMEDHGNVIIAADHGTSRLAVLARSAEYKTKDGAVKYKYGRYCQDAQNDYSEIAGCIPYDDLWVFANYESFSQHGTPTNEIHGGASLEEMVVPVIQIFSGRGVATHKPIITWFTETVKMCLDKMAEVRFALDKPVEKVVALVDNERIICSYENGEYFFRHRVGTKTSYVAKLIAQTLIGEIRYTVKKGISSNIDI